MEFQSLLVKWDIPLKDRQGVSRGSSILAYALTIVVVELAYHTYYKRKYLSPFNGISFVLIERERMNSKYLE